MKLRQYQIDSINLAKQSLASGNKRIVIDLATGGGKSLVCETIISGALAKNKRVMFLVNRVQLADQMSDHLSRAKISHGVIQGQNTRSTYHNCIIASIDTIHARGYPEVDLILADECFTGDALIATPMGLKRIDSLRCGDMVYNQCGMGAVEAVSIKPSIDLYLLEFNDGTNITCTRDHPIFTSSGWKAAGELVIGENFFSLEGMRVLWENVRALDKNWPEWEENFRSFGSGLEKAALLLKLLLEENQEPNEQQRSEGKSKGEIKRDQAQTYSARRERAIITLSSASNSSCIGGRLGIGSGYCDKSQERKWLSDMLQNRHSEQGENDWDRVGRGKSFIDTEKGAGQEKNRFSYFPRLVNISRIKQESARAVFNIRVSGHPSYFANGKLVHNCHGAAGSKKYLQLIEHYKDIPIIGVTATSFVKGLGKQYPFGKLFQDVIRAITIPELIEQGYLVDVDIYAPCDPDLSGVKMVAGDYQEEQLAKAMDKPVLVGDIIQTWSKLAKGKQTIVFAVDIAHSMHIVEQFIKNGVSAEHIDYRMDYETKKSIVRRFKNREFTVLSNCSLLAEGFDAPATECMILARPTKNLKRFTQMCGRILRIFEGKKKGILLDHSGSTRELGYPTEHRELFLCDGKPNKSSGSAEKKKEFELSKCPSCFYLRKKAGKCPICGYTPKKQSEVGSVKGDLKIVPRKGKTKKPIHAGLDKQTTYSELLHIEHERGYKPGFASNQYRNIFGVWPRGLMDMRKPPSLEIRNLVTSSMIRFSKGAK